MSSSDNVSGDGNGVREEENVLSVVDMSNGHSQDQNHEQDQIAGENIQSYAENNEPEVSLEKESEEIIKMALSTVVESHPSYSWTDLKNMKKIHQKLVEI